MWLQKELALATTIARPTNLEPMDIALLREESYVLTSDGEPRKTKRFLRIEENVLFTVRVLAKIEGLVPEIDLTSDGWCALKESIRVRNRVTHPRSATDLDVTATEFERLVVGYGWAIHLLNKALARSYLKAHERMFGKAEAPPPAEPRNDDA